MLAALSFMVGCKAPCVFWNDKCEKLCCEVGSFLEDNCREDSWAWPDLGASDRGDFVSQCIRDWDDLNGDLSTYEAQQAIQVCDTTRTALDLNIKVDDSQMSAAEKEAAVEELTRLKCDEIVTLYLFQ